MSIKEWLRPKKPWEKKPFLLSMQEPVDSFFNKISSSLSDFDHWLQRFNSIFAKILIVPLFAICAGGIGALVYSLMGSHTIAMDPLLSESVDPQVIQQDLSRYLADGNYAAAWDKLEALRAVWSQDARLYQAEGALHMVDTKDFERARASFTEALKYAPGDAVLTFHLAEAEFAMGNYDAASRLYSSVRYDLKDNDLILFRLFLCKSLIDSPLEASAISEKHSPAFHSPSWFYIRIYQAFKSGNMDEGTRLLESAKTMYGEKTRIFDQTLADLGVTPN